MAPSVLARVVTGNLQLDPTLGIKVHNAVLQDHQRHALKDKDYPAIRPRKGHTVLGTVGYNFSDSQLKSLDIFEGNEYKRVLVNILDTTTQKECVAWAYVWKDEQERELLSENWSYDNFVKYVNCLFIEKQYL